MLTPYTMYLKVCDAVFCVTFCVYVRLYTVPYALNENVSIKLKKRQL